MSANKVILALGAAAGVTLMVSAVAHTSRASAIQCSELEYAFDCGDDDGRYRCCEWGICTTDARVENNSTTEDVYVGIVIHTGNSENIDFSETCWLKFDDTLTWIVEIDHGTAEPYTTWAEVVDLEEDASLYLYMHQPMCHSNVETHEYFPEPWCNSGYCP